jgi:2-phosphoglycerate kinase
MTTPDAETVLFEALLATGHSPALAYAIAPQVERELMKRGWMLVQRRAAPVKEKQI